MQAILSANDLRAVAQLSRFAATPAFNTYAPSPSKTVCCGWRDVPLALDTLEEINAQNRRVPFATLYRTDSGAVLLEAHCML
jgi:hypothetical protein